MSETDPTHVATAASAVPRGRSRAASEARQTNRSAPRHPKSQKPKAKSQKPQPISSPEFPTPATAFPPPVSEHPPLNRRLVRFWGRESLRADFLLRPES